MEQDILIFQGAIPSDPAAITMAFITDYEKWNSFANSSYKATDSFAHAETSYDSLIFKYCGFDKQHFNLAFGSDSNHKIGRTEIKECIIAPDRAVVSTIETGDFGFTSEYQYHFTEFNDRWHLEEVYYLDEYDNKKPLPGL